MLGGGRASPVGWSKKILANLDSHPSAAIPANHPAKITPSQFFVLRPDNRGPSSPQGERITFGWGVEFAGHDLDSPLIARPIIQQPLQQPASMPVISIITGAQSGKPPGMPHNRSISFSAAHYPLPEKTAPRSFQLQSLYRL